MEHIYIFKCRFADTKKLLQKALLSIIHPTKGIICIIYHPTFLTMQLHYLNEPDFEQAV